jgi:hypothetical protein
MLSTLLATKLHRPHLTPNLLARLRCARRLDEGLQSDHNQFVLAAPQTMISVLPTNE